MTAHEIEVPTVTPVLYHSEMSVCAAKVRMLFAEKQVGWEGHLLDLRAGEAQAPDYVKLNPNQVVPTLVCGGDVVIESNVILEYIEDRWRHAPARPAVPFAAARMRLWMRQLDDSVHAATAVVSVCVALRHQFLQRGPDAIRQWLDNMVDPARRARSKAAIEQGMDAPQFADAVRRFVRLLDDFERALADSDWLVGNEFSLADIAYAPYVLRLGHLGFGDLIEARPHVAAWRDRLFLRPSFKAGVTDWLNPAAVDLFERERAEASRRIADIAGLNPTTSQGDMPPTGKGNPQ
jgi:glutathione S-transferase